MIKRYELDLMSLKQVMEITGLGRSTIYTLISNKNFPKPVKIGLRKIAFRQDDINIFLNEKGIKINKIKNNEDNQYLNEIKFIIRRENMEDNIKLQIINEIILRWEYL
jgi:prophage regulatory protein